MRQKEEKIFNYLNENTTSGEQKEIEKWIEESSSNNKVFEEVSKLYTLTDLDVESFSPSMDDAWNKVSEKTFKTEEAKIVKMNFNILFKVAAVLVLCTGLGYFFFTNTPKINQIATVNGQIQKVELADGTQVWINENTTFKFPEEFSDKEREVYLEGEAYFDVTKNPEKPFVIRSKNTFTQVLGTSFNLLATNQKSEVNVTSGKVALVNNNDNSNKAILVKGEKGILQDGVVKKSEDFDANSMAWKTKQIVFESANVNEVAEVLKDYYNIEIEYAENITDCLITSTFEDVSIEEIFEVLKVIAQINNTYKDGIYHLTGPGC